MYAETLQLVKDFPSPNGIWELVENIGQCRHPCLPCYNSSFRTGEGNYGEVFKGRNLQTGQIAAVKVMDAVLEKEEDIKAELNVFQHHSAHQNLVKFFGAFVKRDSVAEEQIWIVMEVSSTAAKIKEKLRVQCVKVRLYCTYCTRRVCVPTCAHAFPLSARLICLSFSSSNSFFPSFQLTSSSHVFLLLSSFSSCVLGVP